MIEQFSYTSSMNVKISLSKGHVAVSLQYFDIFKRNYVYNISTTSFSPHITITTACLVVKSYKQFPCVSSTFNFYLVL